MPELPNYDYAKPKTPHDILQSWSQGHIPTEQAKEMLQQESDESIFEMAEDNALPVPSHFSVKRRF